MSDTEHQSGTLQQPAELTALVVDDDEVIVMVLDHLLSRRGFRVEKARDGRQAALCLETLGTPPALVLLDVMMPYLDGFELITKIRAHPTWNRVPIIMLTAKSQEKNIVRALDDGANDYVVKPFRPGELMARIRRLVNLP